MSLFLAAAIGAQAQGDYVSASVQSVKGFALIYPSASSSPFALKQNTQVEPDNMIETRQNGRVVITLSDGGRITILPNSKVILKKFQFAQSARELLEILVGRVLVKIHHAPGKQNPYSLSSPAASIAVRGTEFIVDVQSGGETLVLVREGLVEVWPRDNPNNKRLVSPGDRVTIQPGGRISSVFPTPRRSLETVRQNTDGGSTIFFSAFPDQHLDSLDNPAYATEFKDAQGRLLLLPSVTSPHHIDKNYVNEGNSNSQDMPLFDYDVSPQVTFFTPIPGSRFVVGGDISAAHTRNLQVINEEYTNYLNHRINARKLNAVDASIIAAYSFGDQGRTSVGIGIDRLSGDENLSINYNNKANTYYNGTGFNHSIATVARTRLTLGLTRRLSESMKIGLYYRHSFNLSDQENQLQHEYNDEIKPEYSYFIAGRAKISASASSSELGFRFRGSLTRKLFYGAQGSYLYERIRSREEVQSRSETTAQPVPQTVAPPVSDNRYLGRRANLGAGVGFLLTSKLLLNFDLAGSLFNNPRPIGEPIILGLNSVYYPSYALASSVYAQNNIREWSVSGHIAAQANPWRNLILSTSVLKTYHKYNYPDMAVSIGSGWKFKPNLIAEYVISAQYGDRGPTHAIRLRYTFNLGITNEK